MAGERKGKAVEALLVLCFERLGYSRGRDLHWGQRPPGFSIDPDVILGKLKSPTHWIMVTTSVSPNNSNMKFWRNAGELFEVKRVFSPIPRVISFVLESNQELGLIEAMNQICDGAIHVDEIRGGQALIRLVTEKADEFPMESELFLQALQTAVQASASSRQAFANLTEEVRAVLKNRNKKLDSLWSLLQAGARTRTAKKRVARKTFLKRGIAKLLLFEPAERQTIYAAIRSNKPVKTLPQFALDLDIARKSIGRVMLVDDEIAWVVSAIPERDIESIISKTRSEGGGHWTHWISEIRESKAAKHHLFLLEHHAELIQRAGMRRMLRTCETNGRKWLFWHLIEVFKLAVSRKQGYGFAVLAEDVGYKQGISQGYKVLADWANGVNESRAPTKLIDDVADAMSRRLGSLDFQVLDRIGRMVGLETLTNLFEQKFVSYPYFEPAPLLLDAALRRVGLAYERHQRHPTWIGEYLGRVGQLPVPVLMCKNTMIHWKSGYDSGKHHKVKELSGKGPALRFSYQKDKFLRRPGVKKTILLVDGTFEDFDLDALRAADWDEIYYPDEIDKLSRSII